jgi:hypothetical protein
VQIFGILRDPLVYFKLLPVIAVTQDPTDCQMIIGQRRLLGHEVAMIGIIEEVARPIVPTIKPVTF